VHKLRTASVNALRNAYWSLGNGLVSCPISATYSRKEIANELARRGESVEWPQEEPTTKNPPPYLTVCLGI
jgi:hypothetical protein